MFAYVGLRTACFDTPLGAMRLLVDAHGALLRLDFEDEITAGACVTRREEVPA